MQTALSDSTVISDTASWFFT